MTDPQPAELAEELAGLAVNIEDDDLAGRLIRIAARLRSLGELTVVHVRDPDAACSVSIYDAAGREVPSAMDDVDAGAGHDGEEWQQRITDAQALPASDYRDELLAALGDPPGARHHITGWKDED